MELRFPKKMTTLTIVIFVILSFFGYLRLKHFGYDSGMASAVSLTIPSMILFYILSKHRDSRFFFTFCSIDIMGLIVIIFSRAIAIRFNDNLWLIFVLTNLGLIGMLLLSLKYRQKYIMIQNQLQTGWTSLTFLSVLFYTMLYFVISYPIPLKERREYVPVAILYSLIVIVVYVVIFQTIMKSQKIYNVEQERELLETKLALQSSQLELKEVYYKMAFTDALTGLKNRAAFEGIKSKLQVDKALCQNLTCLSMDLNNLKETNDMYGHSEGDRLIQTFGQILKQSFSDHSNIYRVGGDEFIVLFFDMSETQIKHQIKTFNQCVDHNRMATKLPISVAMGMAAMNESLTDDVETLINISDKRMYQDKDAMKAQSES